MNTTFEQFAQRHISATLELWERTENIGLSDVDAPERISQFLERNPRFSFVAVVEDEIVGAVLCGHDGRRGYIHHLAVDSRFRQSGIGTSLVSRCLAQLREAGIRKCHAFVFHTNEYGELFWQRQGWQRRDDLQLYSIHTNA